MFLAIHQQRERFDPSVGTARTWVLTIRLLQIAEAPTLPLEPPILRPHVDEAGDGRDPALIQPEFIQRSVEEKEIVEQGLASLSPAQRRIMELLHFEGYTLREISQMEGKELGAIRNSYYRGLKVLKTVLSVGVRRTTVRTTISAKRQEEYEIEL